MPDLPAATRAPGISPPCAPTAPTPTSTPDAVRAGLTGPLAVDVQGLGKRFGDAVVLDGLDLAVPAGTVTALLGPNGAGKTTTVRILATLLTPDRGRALVAGHDVVHARRQVRRRISLTGQATAVDGRLTGEENLHVVARLAGLGREQARRRTADLLEQVDLVEAGRRRVGEYSGGMRRRLDLALGLVTVPEVMFLDEPTTGLDPRSRQDLWAAVERLAASGSTVLLTTQDLEEADRLADHVAVLDAGRVVAHGTPAQLKHRVAPRRLVLTLADPSSHAAVEAALGTDVVTSDPVALTLAVPAPRTARDLRDLLDALDPTRTLVTGFADHEAGLDEVFLALTAPAGGPR